MPSWFWLLIAITAVVALLAIVFWAVYDSSKRVQPDDKGWIKLSLSAGFKIFIILGAVIAAFILGLFLRAAVNDKPLEMWLFGIFGLPFSAAGLYGLSSAFFVKVRFNDLGIEYYRFSKRLCISWNDIREIAGNIIAGAVIITPNSRFGLSSQLKGFFQLVEEAEKHGVKVDKFLKSMQ